MEKEKGFHYNENKKTIHYDETVTGSEIEKEREKMPVGWTMIRMFGNYAKLKENKTDSF